MHSAAVTGCLDAAERRVRMAHMRCRFHVAQLIEISATRAPVVRQ
jgi:hypothetical protein